MTGGIVVILGEVGDNFAAGMTGGLAFIYDKSKEFEKKVNNESVVWQNVETDYWKTFLKDLKALSKPFMNAFLSLSFFFRILDASMGERVSATSDDSATAAAIVKANSVNNWPISPSKKVIGTKTDIKTTVVAIIAKPTCLAPLYAAIKGVSP